MAITERLALLIDADAQGAVREMEKVGKTAERELGRTEDRFDKLGKSMQSTGIKMMATSAVLGAGMWKAGQQAADLEQAVGGTEAVFGSAAVAIEDFASRSASSAGLSERAARELTSSLGALLQGFGFTRDEAAATSVQLAQLGADLAATFGGAPEEAVAALGAALRGEFDPLERFGVSLNVSQANLKAVEMGLATTTSQVDLNARAQASLALIMERSQAAQGQFGRELDTTSGKLAVTKAEFEDAQAQLGQGFLPVMTSVAGAASDAIGAFVALDSATGGVASQVAGFGTVALGTAGALSWVVGKGIESRDMFVKGGEAAAKFARNLGMSRTSALATGGALGALGVALGAGILLWQRHEAAQRAAQDRADSMLDTLDATTLALTEQSAARTVEQYKDQIDNLDRAKVSMEELQAATMDSTVGERQWQTLRKGTAEQHYLDAAATDVVIDALRGREDAMSRLIVKMHEAGELGEGEVKMLREESAAYVDSTAQAESRMGVMGREIATRLGLVGVTDDQAAADGEAGEAASAWATKQAELNDELKDAQGELDKATKAVLGYFDALDGSVDAEMKFHEALDSLNSTLKDNGTQWSWVGDRIDITTEKGRENTEAMQEARDAIVGMGQQHLEMTGSAQEAASMVGLLTEGLRQQMAQAGYTKEQQDKLLESLGLTPEQVITAYSQPGLQEGLDKTRALRSAIESLPDKQVRIQAFVDAVRTDGLFGAIAGRRASGGPVAKGSLYEVGERGPEMFVDGGRTYLIPGQGGHVIPATSGGGTASDERAVSDGFRSLAESMSRSADSGEALRDALEGQAQAGDKAAKSLTDVAREVSFIFAQLQGWTVFEDGSIAGQPGTMVAGVSMHHALSAGAYGKPGAGFQGTGARYVSWDHAQSQGWTVYEDGSIAGHPGVMVDPREMTGAHAAGVYGGARRRGGPVEAGKAYLVGEEGPELVVPRQSGTVIPAGPTAALGGETVIHTHVYMDGREVAYSLDRLAREHGGAR